MKKSLLLITLVLGGWLILAQSCFTFRTADAKAISKFQEDGILLKTVTVKQDGFPIHYVQTGNDSLPTLIFIHGTPGSWNAFEMYLRDSLLRAHYRMISIDRPGFGYSNFGKAMNLPEQSRLMGPVLESLKNKEACWLVGHSLGGPMILQLALDYPTLANGLVVISGSIDPAAEKPERWRYIMDKTPLKLFLPGAFRPSNTELIYLKKDLKIMEPALSAISLPVYFIHGRSDSWVPPVNVEFGLKKLINAPKLDTLWLNGGHFIPWTEFQPIRKKLLELMP
jgi:pimeloyl-ACP methyl ester carboxylesterase